MQQTNSPSSFVHVLNTLAPYTSGSYNPQILIENDYLYIYLPKNKQLSRGVRAEIERVGWKYDEKYHRLIYTSGVIAEFCTHENVYIRDQARRHLEATKK